MPTRHQMTDNKRLFILFFFLFPWTCFSFVRSSFPVSMRSFLTFSVDSKLSTGMQVKGYASWVVALSQLAIFMFRKLKPGEVSHNARFSILASITGYPKTVHANPCRTVWVNKVSFHVSSTTNVVSTHFYFAVNIFSAQSDMSLHALSLPAIVRLLGGHLRGGVGETRWAWYLAGLIWLVVCINLLVGSRLDIAGEGTTVGGRKVGWATVEGICGIYGSCLGGRLWLLLLGWWLLFIWRSTHSISGVSMGELVDTRLRAMLAIHGAWRRQLWWCVDWPGVGHVLWEATVADVTVIVAPDIVVSVGGVLWLTEGMQISNVKYVQNVLFMCKGWKNKNVHGPLQKYSHPMNFSTFFRVITTSSCVVDQFHNLCSLKQVFLWVHLLLMTLFN